jgi:hypothetical protein
MPSSVEPSEVSDLISDRLGIPSTKYGPSICCGVGFSLMEAGVSVQALTAEAAFCEEESSENGPNCTGLIDKI